MPTHYQYRLNFYEFCDDSEKPPNYLFSGKLEFTAEGGKKIIDGLLYIPSPNGEHSSSCFLEGNWARLEEGDSSGTPFSIRAYRKTTSERIAAANLVLVVSGREVIPDLQEANSKIAGHAMIQFQGRKQDEPPKPYLLLGKREKISQP